MTGLLRLLLARVLGVESVDPLAARLAVEAAIREDGDR